jgi:hypothetical protein
MTSVSRNLSVGIDSCDTDSPDEVGQPGVEHCQPGPTLKNAAGVPVQDVVEMHPGSCFDGIHPSFGTISMDQAMPLRSAGLYDPSHPDPVAYNRVLDSLGVEGNLRYEKVVEQKMDHGKPVFDANGDPVMVTKTYCNIYVSDATAQLGALISHWGMEDGSGWANPNQRGAEELGATKTCKMLESHGAEANYHRVLPSEAYAQASKGLPTVVVGSSDGHIAMVRAPTQPFSSERNIEISQAGGHNFSDGPLEKGFGKKDKVEFYSYGDSAFRIDLPAASLAKGSNGDDVVMLQRALVKSGQLKESDMNLDAHFGKFDGLTDRALTQFKQQHGITEDGYGPQTHAALSQAIGS